MADSAEDLALHPTARGGRRYSAFLSYSHTDLRFARRLQRRLETYRLPRRLAKATEHGVLSRGRLKPVFRDTDELSAASDLTKVVREAIAESEFLIVVCSPHSAQSEWVGREIDFFRHLHGDRRILAALIDGGPETAFHAALRRRSRGPAREPLAADFRPKLGSGRAAFLKLVAPMAGVQLDDLIHRDAQRRHRQIASLAALGLAGMAVMGMLAGVAMLERAAAERERNKAQALVGVMSDDLRNEARGVASLDYLARINAAAADYFKDQDLRRMPATALQERARVLWNMGEDDEKRGDLAAAQREFEEAHSNTGALLAKAPNDPKRIFDHAQSEYWVGFINWRNGDGAAARAHFQAYAALAERLVRMDPTNDTWLMETAYAANNLGMLAMRQAGRLGEAQDQFSKALRIREEIAQRRPADRRLKRATANALAWLADTQRLSGDLKGAQATREAQRQILTTLLDDDPNNLEIRNALIGYDLAVARIDAAQGKFRQAIRRLQAGQKAEAVLERGDPQNKDFAKQARMLQLFEVRAWLDMPVRLRPPAASLAAKLGDCAPATPTLANEEIDDFCDILLARVRRASGDETGASEAMAPVQRRLAAQHDVLTAHWGLNLREEAAAIQIAARQGEGR